VLSEIANGSENDSTMIVGVLITNIPAAANLGGALLESIVKS
jgi:hypothetical protein